MFEKQLLNGILTKGFDLLPKKPVAQNGKKIRYERIKDFLLQPNFNGFTKDDLFIMQFIKKPVECQGNTVESVSQQHPKQRDQVLR